MNIGGAILGGLTGLAGMGASAASAVWSKAEARRNRRFQKEMSNTAYQRGMEDMRKAGLNPVLAYKQGGASTPGGAVGSTPDLGRGVETGIRGGLAKSQVQANTATAKAGEANAVKTAAEARVASARADYLTSPEGQKALAGQEWSKVGWGPGALGAGWEMLKGSAKDVYDRFQSPSEQEPQSKAKPKPRRGRWSVDDDWQNRLALELEAEANSAKDRAR